jgi:hypothetical protein
LEAPDKVTLARAAVEAALKLVHDANEAYIKACKDLADAKLDLAREKAHPWAGMSVYRIMKGERTKHREERGVVCFKEYTDPDYGNSHISPGTYYVLVDGKSAHWLDDSWMLDLL